MKNRYGSILTKYNQDILKLVPYNPFLFNVGANEIKRLAKNNARILEIGSGEGDSALPILEQTSVSLDLLDVSKEMIALSKQTLKKYNGRARFICEDAYTYLKRAEPYDIIFSAWTLHNFNQADKEKLVRATFANLKPGGMFMLLDKVYPISGGATLLKKQNDRYARHAIPKVARAIIAHEIEDASDTYRMDERPLLKLFNQIGFRKLEIIDRVERDVVLLAQK